MPRVLQGVRQTLVPANPKLCSHQGLLQVERHGVGRRARWRTVLRRPGHKIPVRSPRGNRPRGLSFFCGVVCALRQPQRRGVPSDEGGQEERSGCGTVTGRAGAARCREDRTTTQSTATQSDEEKTQDWRSYGGGGGEWRGLRIVLHVLKSLETTRVCGASRICHGSRCGWPAALRSWSWLGE